MDMQEYNKNDTVLLNVMDGEGVIIGKDFDTDTQQYIYRIKVKSLILCNVTINEIEGLACLK